jgi:hypothetical protein
MRFRISSRGGFQSLFCQKDDRRGLCLSRLNRRQTDPLNRLFAQQVDLILGKRMRMPEYVLQ